MSETAIANKFCSTKISYDIGRDHSEVFCSLAESRRWSLRTLSALN